MIYLQQLTLTEIIAKVEVLIDTGNRDVERLQHIYDMIVNEKPLYHPDQVYLETKLQPPIQNTNSISAESSKTKQMHQYTVLSKKEILKELNFYEGEINNYFDNNLKNAILNFQKKYFIIETVECNKPVLGEIFRVI